MKLAEGVEQAFLDGKDDFEQGSEQGSGPELESVPGNDVENQPPGLDDGLPGNANRPELQQGPNHQDNGRARSQERRAANLHSRDRSRSPIRQDKHRSHTGRYRSRTPEDECRRRNYGGMPSYGEEHQPSYTDGEGKRRTRSQAEEMRPHTKEEACYISHISDKHTNSPRYKKSDHPVQHSHILGMPPPKEAPPLLPLHGIKRSRLEQEYDEDDYLGRFPKKPRKAHDQT